MDKKLASMFEYQLFEPSKRLSEIIRRSTERMNNMLTDEELFTVSAAGEARYADKEQETQNGGTKEN